MTATTTRITFVNVDVAGLMHALQVEPQFLAFHADRPFNAHQTASVVFPLHCGRGRAEFEELPKYVSLGNVLNLNGA